MPTLILPHRHRSDYTVMWRTAIALGWRTERWPLRPPFPKIEDDFVLYCEPLTAVIFRDATGWEYDEIPFDWLARLPFTYLRRKVVSGRLDERAALSANWPGPWFIKPARDKIFAAAIYQSLADPAFDDLRGDTPILISAPVTFLHEWRFFVAHRKVEAYSIYARNGDAFRDKWVWEQEEEDQANTYMQTILDDLNVPLLESQVVDIGFTPEGWAIIESNDSYASGIYACDPEGVLRALIASPKHLVK